MRRVLQFEGKFASESIRSAFQTWFQGQYSADYDSATAQFVGYRIKGIFLHVHVEFVDPDVHSLSVPTTTVFPDVEVIAKRSELLKRPVFSVTQKA